MKGESLQGRSFVRIVCVDQLRKKRKEIFYLIVKRFLFLEEKEKRDAYVNGLFRFSFIFIMISNETCFNFLSEIISLRRIT